MKRFFSGENYLTNKRKVFSNANKSPITDRSKFEDNHDELNSFRLNNLNRNKYDGELKINNHIISNKIIQKVKYQFNQIR